ncbi:MAG: winged helix-turn-helix domain-containing protein [Pseudomonadota bacterium]
MKKILLTHLPPAVEQALTEQLIPFRSLEAISLKKGDSGSPGLVPDLVITGEAEEQAGYPGCPVLFLSATKTARLGAVLRQMGQMLAQPVLYIDDILLGPYVFKPQEKSLTPAEGEEIALTDREADILAYLVRHRGRPVSRDELLKNVWQYQEGVDTHTLETHIYRLRQKIEVSADDPSVLLTVEGGYSLHLPERGI